MLRLFILLLHNCVRLNDQAMKSSFLVPNLWPHIYPASAVRNTEDYKNYAAFLAFAHMHALVSDRANGPITIDRFPRLNNSFEDIKYLNKLWHMAHDTEKQILGGYIAATGGAAIHVTFLRDLMANLNISNESRDKLKPLLENMSSIAMESSTFAEEMTRNGLLTHLKTIWTRSGLDLTGITDTVCLFPE